MRTARGWQADRVVPTGGGGLSVNGHQRQVRHHRYMPVSARLGANPPGSPADRSSVPAGDAAQEGSAGEGGRASRVLADAITPGRHDTTLHFPGERKTATLGELWEAGRPVAGWLAARGTAPVAVVLSNTLACATVLVGAIAAGAHVVSVPPPLRVVDSVRYARFLSASCARSGATALVVDASYISRLPPLPEVTYSSYDEVLRAPIKGRRHPADFVLTQYTVGATGEPKGVVLGQDRLLAGVEAIVAWIGPEPGDGVCSWFPLSHAMGLVGMFLTALVGTGPGWADGGDVVLLTPEMFRRRPEVWLEACAAYRSSITASAPNFGFEMATRRRPPHPVDLSRIRLCLTGSEPIRARTLMEFTGAFRGSGLADGTVCPAYGASECLLVTATPPGRGWSALAVDPAALGAGRVVPKPAGAPVVSSGRPLPGYEVRVDGEDQVGEILVAGPSVAERYADGTAVARSDGWLATGDIGFEAGGDLYVLGRLGDMMEVGGTRIYAVELENRIGGLEGVRTGRVSVTEVDGGGLCVAAELGAGVRPAGLAAAVRGLVRDRTGLDPRVLLVERGRLPLDLGGKVQRHAVRAAIEDGTLGPDTLA